MTGWIYPDALHQWIKTRNSSFTRIVDRVEIVMILTLLFVTAMFFKDPLLQGHDRILMVAGLASLLSAAFIWTGRIAREKREVNFSDSLVGNVELSIDTIDYQIWRMRSFVWWFAAPMSLGLLLGCSSLMNRSSASFTSFSPPYFSPCFCS